jgi:NAD(P)-dependent dehydrogenase (short-subunit alcohol dehydrogenase family)
VIAHQQDREHHVFGVRRTRRRPAAKAPGKLAPRDRSLTQIAQDLVNSRRRDFPEEPRSFLQQLRRPCPIALLINNAAIYGDIDWSDNSLEYLRKVLDVNLIGILVCSRAVFPGMKRQRSGSIINISSIAAYPWPWSRTRDPDALEYLNATADERRTWSWEPAQDLETIPSSAYGLGKWGVIYYTRAYARSLGVYGIRVNAIAPGAVLTDATLGVLRGLPRAEAMERIASDNLFATFVNVAALRRLVEPTDLAGVAAFLASDDAAMITGQVLVVDAGIEMRS